MLGIGALAAAVRTLYILVVTPHYRPVSDADQYLDIARNIAHGNGIAMQWPQLEVHATAFRPPLSPVLLGGWVWLVGDTPGAARWLNVALGVLNAVLCMLCGREVAGTRCGLAFGVGYAVYLPFIANDTSTLAETPAITLTLVLLLAIARRRSALAGVAGGLLMLTKPAAQGLVVLLTVALAIEVWRTHRASPPRDRLIRSLRTAAVTGLAAAALVAPWLVRNHIELGATTLVTSNGFNLTAIYGDHARATGGFVDPVYDPANQSLGERLLRLDEARWNDELTARGLRGIRSDPTYVARVVWRNLGAWFELTPGVNNGPELLDGRDPRHRVVSVVEFYLVAAVGAVGLVGALRQRGPGRRVVGFAVMTAVYFAATSLVFVAVPRLRSIFDLVLLLGVAWVAAHHDRVALLQVGERDGLQDRVGGRVVGGNGSRSIRRSRSR